MQILVVLFFVGIASALPTKTAHVASEELVQNLIETLDQFSSPNAYADEKDTKKDVEKELRETLNKILQKIKDAIDQGKKVREDFLTKMKELRQKMKDLNIDIGDNSKELLEKIKEKTWEYFKELLEKLGKNEKYADSRQEIALAEGSFKELLRKLRDILKESIEVEALKQKIMDMFGEGTKIVHELLQILKEKGKDKLKIFLDFILDDDEDKVRSSRSIKEMWEKVKDYFKDLKIDLQEKYMKFGEWVKSVYDKSSEHSKDKFDNIRAIATEFIRHAKNISKEVAGEAQEFFRQYKEELGNLWEEVKETANEIFKRKD